MKSTTKFLITLTMIIAALFVFGPAASAQTCDGDGKNFIDLDGDGFNDNAPDADGDGIPNGLDEDWVKYAQDGDGYKHMNQKGAAADKFTSELMSQLKVQNQVQSRHMIFSERRAMIMGETSENRLGTLGVDMGDGIFNPGIGDGPENGGPGEDVGHKGTGGN